MRSLKSILLGLATFGVASSALGANSDVTVSVTPLPTQTSISRSCTVSSTTGLVTCSPTNYAAYAVTLRSNVQNTINQVVVSGDTGVWLSSTDTNPSSQTANFIESVPSGLCTASDPQHIQCNVGQLGGYGSTTFYVAFTSPPDVDATTGATFNYPDAGAYIKFHWEVTFSQAQSPCTPTSNLCDVSGNTTTALITTNTTSQNSELATYIPTSGGTFFTGRTGTAFSPTASTDLSMTQTTKLGVPAEGLKTAKIQQVIATGGLTNDTLYQFTTTLTVPNKDKFGNGVLFTSPITIYLRRDSSTIRSFNQINRVPLYYSSTDPSEPVVVNYQLIPSCYDTSVYPLVAGPSQTSPICVDQRVPISKKTTSLPDGTPITSDDIGDWMFVIKALENGQIAW